MGNVRSKKKSRAYRRRKRRLGIILVVFALLLILCICLIVRAILSMPYEEVDLSQLVNITYTGYDSAGNAEVSFDEAKIDELMSKLKTDYDESFLHSGKVEDSDYVMFRQSLTCGVLGAPMAGANTSVSLSGENIGAAQNGENIGTSQDISVNGIAEATAADTSMGLRNGSVITVNCNYDEELAKKLKLEVTSASGQFTVGGLPTVSVIGVDEVFEGLNVSFSGISPNLTMSMENTSANPLVSRMNFEIVEPKEFYRDGDVVKVRAVFSEELCLETKYVVDAPMEECVREYTVASDSSYLTSADQLPNSILKEAIDAGKKAFKDANEYGVRIYCEANLVPVYINKKATFEYGAPNYVSSYFKTVFPEKAGELGMSYNDLDIIYDVKITQADGVSCVAYAAVRFTNIIQNSDGSYSYDFSNPKILSESYFSANVKKNVTESYKSTHNVERVYP